MAPFIPEGLVNPSLLLFFALILGIGFGYILEQAGFSSSRKLAGLFYGYDFVVLKVFFTAGVTAMTGLLFFSYLGWIDMSLVYINPTFLWSAIIGGLIMGAGFIMGGFCPGTSLVGAVIGKVDAMVFIGGMFIGMFLFGHFYAPFEPLYTGSFLGNIQIFSTLGISKAWFALILASVALIAFVVTQMIEDKVNKTEPSVISQRPSYRLPAILLIGFLTLFLFLPPERTSGFAETPADQLLMEWHQGSAKVSAEKLVFDIMNERKDVVYIDLRDSEQYQRFTLPGALNMDPEEVLDRKYRPFFRNDPREKIFFSDGSSLSTQVWTIARRAGHQNIYMLDGGLNGMFEMIFTDAVEEENNDYMYGFSKRFAREARQFFSEGGAADKTTKQPTPVHTIIEVQVPATSGGC